MKNLIFIPLLLISFFGSAHLSIEGSYQGKNLYVQNPEDDAGFGFCATKVTINGDIMPGNLGRSAFEIDFSLVNIKVGEPVFIVIEHNDGCMPKILNPEVLLPRSTFDIEEIAISEDNVLNWVTTNEQGKLPFIVEQFRWNKWVNAGIVQGEGTAEKNEYTFELTPHSGENKVRVVQVDHSGAKRKSPEKTFESSVPQVEMAPKKVKTEIKFTAKGQPVETKYEIFDAYGNIVKKGFASEVNCENLRKGAYYINFDNQSEKFIKN